MRKLLGALAIVFCSFSVSAQTPTLTVDPVAGLYSAGQRVTLSWNFPGTACDDGVVISIKQDGAVGSTPDGEEWFRFTGSGFTFNDGVESVYVPEGLKLNPPVALNVLR